MMSTQIEAVAEAPVEDGVQSFSQGQCSGRCSVMRVSPPRNSDWGRTPEKRLIPGDQLDRDDLIHGINAAPFSSINQCLVAPLG
jgi:hypothetical protein